MTFYEKVKNLCKLRGISITSLATELGFSKSTGTTWKKSNSVPRNSTVKKISDYFNVPITYFTDDNFVNLHGNNNVIGNGNLSEKHLTEQENALLHIFCELNVVDQAKLLAYASELQENK